MGFGEDALNCVRAETPGVLRRLHLDNCGSSLMPTPVLATLRQHLELEQNVGGYVAHEQQSVAHEQVYASLAKLLGGTSDNYALTSSAVDAWNKAFYSVPFETGDNLVTAFNEYCSNYVAFLQLSKRLGIEVRVAKAGPDGKLDLKHLENLVDKRTRLIAVAQTPSSSGQINPVARIGRIAQAHNILYLLDACQAVGQLPVNVHEIGCDMLTGTSRKFMRGPRGVGFLYASDKALSRLEPAMLTNQSAAWVANDRYELRRDARMFEDWERGVGNQLGFGAAVDYLLHLGPARVFERTQSVAADLRSKLYSIKDVAATCPADASAAIITFNKKGLTAAEVKKRLEEQDIAVQVASVVHTRLDLGARGVETTVRVSPHYYNTHEEIDRFVGAVDALTA
ncbi:aminotransferase class V-fold PLP-dependent enzyme [Kordiimonas aestuarii]|uniref:aminotransferase class V-fold PLP-dependent enzyme n=1 Tax=Kordiimonas aestuarii TaxID=1005925 RepID=UPI0021D1DD96|nr:aminotransferase class V-fold PLP-dependent enzyme [Kordiimonas aestuarii]